MQEVEKMSYCIEVNHLNRTFKVAEKSGSGFMSSIHSLFHRQYKHVEAVKDISFTVEKGEIRGLIGPNGAGKSTTIKMLSGILYPSSGEINVLGHVPHLDRNAYVRKIGVVLGQKSQLVWDLPALDSFILNKQIYKIPDAIYEENLNYFTKLLDIEEIIKRPVRQLSLGERMKCELVSSMLHNPELIFLDEPTIGIDILAKDAIINFIREVNEKRQVTFILTTHDISDIETLCEKVTIINHGTIVYDDSLQELKRYFDKKRVIHLSFLHRLAPEDLQNYKVLDFSGLQAQIEINLNGQDISTVLKEVFNDLPIKDLTIDDINVEEVIKELYRGNEVSAT